MGKIEQSDDWLNILRINRRTIEYDAGYLFSYAESFRHIGMTEMAESLNLISKRMCHSADEIGRVISLIVKQSTGV